MRFDTVLATLALAGAGVSAAPLDRRTAEALAAIVRSPNLDGLGPVLPWFPGKVYNSPDPNGEKRDAAQSSPGQFTAPRLGLIHLPGYDSSTISQPPSLQKRQVDLEDLEAWAKSDPLSGLGPRQLGEQKRHVGSQDWSDFITTGDFPVGTGRLASAEKREADWSRTPPLLRPSPENFEEALEPIVPMPPFVQMKRHADPGGLRPITRPGWTHSNSQPAEEKRGAFPQEWLGRPRVPVPKSGGRLAVCGLYIGEC